MQFCRIAARRFLVLSVLSFSLPSLALGQIVQGRLVQTGSGVPVEGALVSLMTESGTIAGRRLTNEMGLFRLHSRGPGLFLIRAERIGYETVTSEELFLKANQVVQIEMETSLRPVGLEGLTVEGTQQCVVRPEDGQALARAWDEAQKALRLQEWTETESIYDFRVSNYEREISAATAVILSETRQSETKTARVPIRGLPVEELLHGGFVQESEDGQYTYYGPDASVLLSDLFLNSHCFELRESDEHPGSIGLSFEPIHGHRLPDIQGTLWLERQTAELQWLEYWYTWAPYPESSGIGNGTIEFQSLPNGTWIVDKWRIQMPNVRPVRNPFNPGITEYQLSTITEVGGEVRQARARDQLILEGPKGGVISGTIWDSITGTPLREAQVFLSGTDLGTISGSDGSFLLDDVPEGVYSLAFSHPLLDSLGIFAEGVTVDVNSSDVLHVRLGIPSEESVLSQRCADYEPGQRGISGFVVLQGTDDPIPGVDVQAVWRDVDNRGIPVERFVQTATNDAGRFFLCSFPSGQRTEIRLQFLGLYGGGINLEPNAPSSLGITLELELPDQNVDVSSVVEESAVERGSQGAQGRVLDSSTGRPIPHVQVSLHLEGLETEVRATSNQDGFFRVVTPEAGAYSVEANALGYHPARRDSLVVEDAHLSILKIQMTPAPLDIDPIVAVVGRRSFRLETNGFYDRAEQGIGYFIFPEDLEDRAPFDMEDVLRSAPGIRIDRTAYGTAFSMFKPGARGAGNNQNVSGLCQPQLIVDGMPVMSPRAASGGQTLGVFPDDHVRVEDVAAVEVHLRATSVPLQFGGTRGSCGAILVWTKGR